MGIDNELQDAQEAWLQLQRLSHKSITAALVIVTQKVLIYKLRVAAGFTSAVHRREASPRPTRVKMVTFWDSLYRISYRSLNRYC